MPKISELTAISNVSTDDLMLIVNDPGGAPSSNKITVQGFASSVTGMLRYANTESAGVVKVGNTLSVNATTGVLNIAPDQSIPQDGRSEGFVLTWDQVTNTIIWQAFSGVHDYINIDNAISYNVEEHDNIIFAEPDRISADIVIILPDSESPIPAVKGKTYTIKNINPGDAGYKVVVTTYAGNLFGFTFLENPTTGNFVANVSITQKGDAQQWIYDGAVWRHLGSQSNLPFFSADANTFTEIALQNQSSGNNASGDIVVYSDVGDPVTGEGPYVDLGINSSQYSNTEYSVNGPNDSYLYSVGGDLTIGTADANAELILHAGGTTNTDIRLTINSTATSIRNIIVTLDDIDGPYASDVDANTAGIPLKGLYYDSSGNIKVRLT